MQAIQPDILPQVMPAAFASRDLVGYMLDFLGDARLATVSHLFHDATRQSMVRSLRTLRGADPQQVAKIEEAIQECRFGVQEWVNLNLSARITRTTRVIDDTLKHSRRINDLTGRRRDILGLTALFPLEGGSRVAARLTMERECQALQAQGLDPTLPEQASAFLAALHKKQKHDASASGVVCRRLFNESLAETGLSLAPARFLKAQTAVLDNAVDTQLDRALNQFWHSFALRIPLAHRPAHPSAQEIRVWMNNPDNEHFLNAIHVANPNLSIIPPEIGRMRGLTNLTVRGPFAGLPTEVGTLQNLWSLTLNSMFLSEFPEEIRALGLLIHLDIRGNFTELPEWLAEMPALRQLEVTAPVRVLSDTIWQRHYRLSDFDRETNLVAGTRLNRFINHTGIQINSDRLTDIPFTRWFKENVHVPYLPVGPFFENATQGIKNVLTRWRADVVGSWLKVPFWIFINGPAWGIFYLVVALHFLLNAPIFLTNLLLDYAIEPALTALRDALGFSRLVHIRDLRPGEA